MSRTAITIRLTAILAVIVLAGALRARAAALLPIDYDEDDYLRAGQEFAHLMKYGDWRGLMETNYRPEHPPLAKIAYGLVLVGLPERPLVEDVTITAPPARDLPEDLKKAARTESAAFGTLTAALLALVNPLGGLVLAIHTFTIKYTSQVMLDGLAALLSLCTILAYRQYKKKERSGWLIASAILLGLAADSKFLHGTVGFAILLDWLYTRREEIQDRQKRGKILRSILIWGFLSLVIFFAAYPYLWPHPLARLQETLEAVRSTTSSPNVVNAAFPAWQPLTFLSMSVPYKQNSAFILLADTFIFFLAIAGFGQMWKKESAFGFWLVFELLLLILWRTKWPQYLLVVTAPLALSAAEGLNILWSAIVTSWRARKVKAEKKAGCNGAQRALPWLVPGLVAFTVLTLLPLVFQFGMSLTDFSAASIRDGFNGGLWRAIWGGLTGQLPVSDFELGTLPDHVNFTGLKLYPAVFDLITRNERWSILFFNSMWTVLSVGLQFGLGLAAALLLWQKAVHLGRAWQALFILPWAIPEYIGALMWFNIFQSEWGWLPLAADKYGANSFFGILASGLENSPSLWLVAYLLPAMWYGFPFMMLAASVGLKAIPRAVLDAAAIDGANASQSFRFVIWPLLVPLLVPALIVRGIFAFNQFYLFQASFFTNATLATLSYNVFNPNSGFGQRGGFFSASAVINLITVIILMVFVLLFSRWSKAEEGVTYA